MYNNSLSKDYIQESFMTEISDFRLLLYTCLYNDIECIDNLISIIKTNMDTNSVEYNSDTKTIMIKIKKTTMKKNQGFSHSASYYYNIFNQVFMQFLNNHAFRLDAEQRGITAHMINNVLLPETTNLIYAITPISDNIIILHL